MIILCCLFYCLPASLVTATLYCGYPLGTQGADISCVLCSEGRSVGWIYGQVLTESSHVGAGDFLEIVDIAVVVFTK